MNDENVLIKKCLWKIISESDNLKREQGNDIVTLSFDKPCYACDGTKEDGISLRCFSYESS